MALRVHNNFSLDTLKIRLGHFKNDLKNCLWDLFWKRVSFLHCFINRKRKGSIFFIKELYSETEEHAQTKENSHDNS